jgi:hypothetical protein
MAPQRCLRCHGPVPDGSAVCGRCNPGHLPAPNPTQYHATVFVVVLLVMAIAIAVLILRG